jgi:hypothetical protein
VDSFEKSILGLGTFVMMFAIITNVIRQKQQTSEQPSAGIGYQCPYCGQSFTTLQELIDHVRSVHPDQPPIQSIDIQWS